MLNYKEKYSGIIPPLVTPLNNDQTYDFASAKKLIEHCIDGGVSGIFVNGTSGEALRVTDSVWRESTKFAIDTASSKIDVFCGAIDSSTYRALERIKFIEDCGGELAVCTAPFYLSSFGQDEILRHFDALCSKTNIKIAVYNIPETTKANILPETISRLAEYDNIVAFKDSTADWQQLQRTLILLEDKDIAVFNGAEELCCISMLFGAQGCIPGLANFIPKQFVSLYNLCKENNHEAAFNLQKQINEVRKGLFINGCWMSAMKGLLEICNLGSKNISAPLEMLTSEQMNQLKKIYADAGINL